VSASFLNCASRLRFTCLPDGPGGGSGSGCGAGGGSEMGLGSMISMGCSVLLIISLLSDELDEIDVDRDMEGVRGGLVQSSTGLSRILCTLLLLLSSSEVAGCSRATSVDIRLLKRELSSMVLMRVGGVVLVVVLIVVVVVKLLVAFGETSTFF
jgi:hypothetical protein